VAMEQFKLSMIITFPDLPAISLLKMEIQEKLKLQLPKNISPFKPENKNFLKPS
jgi:hypothetical protein